MVSNTSESVSIAGYTPAEERANVVTHALGAALSVAGLSVLVSLAAIDGDAWRVAACAVYGSTLVALYLASTLYHCFRSPGIKRLFRVLDHISIYLLIAGTYTPFSLVNMRGGWGWSIFGVIWGLAAAGIVFKIFLTGRLHILSAAVYVGMGWFVLIAMKPVIAAIPPPGIMLLLAGGLSYTLGVVFYAWRRLPYNHAVWHLFVLGGSVCHFLAVLFFVLPAA